MKAEQQRQYRKDKIARGFCTCGAAVVSGKAACADCLAKTQSFCAALRLERISLGLCYQCGDPLDPRSETVRGTKPKGGGRCSSCLERNNHRRDVLFVERVSNGLCGRCGIDPIVGGDRCNKCILKPIARKLWNSVADWELLLNLLRDQGGVCVYSGRILKLGENASVDHIIPSSSGGSDDLTNLQWVDFHVNVMKNNLGEDCFLALIGEIYLKSKIKATEPVVPVVLPFQKPASELRRPRGPSGWRTDAHPLSM